MNCPFCNFDDVRVVDSRPYENKIKRRRECAGCHRRFTTFESIEMPLIEVEKKDHSYEPFSREKLIRGISSAVKKRPVSIQQVSAVVDKIERYCTEERRSKITTSEIGELVLEQLKNIDEVAYIRFASVYREFNDAAGFVAEIGKLSEKIKKD